MGASGPSGQDGGGSRESNKKARKDTEVSAYEREIEKQKAAEKAQKKTTTRKSTDDSRNTDRENKAVSNYTSLTKDDASKIKESKETVQRKTGKSKLDNYELPDSNAPGAVGIALNATKDLRQKSFEANRKFFQEKVLTSKNRGGYEDTFDSYSKYMKDRLSGSIDAYGNPNIATEGGKSTDAEFQTPKETIIKKNVGGTEIQTTQEKVAEEKAKEDEYDVRKIKKRGRRKNILTSSKGVTTVSSDYSLGKPSLLGSV